jgi:SAM-dependent methyltransferase
MRKILPYALIGVVSLAIVGLLRQRRRPIPTPPPLTFLFENPLVDAFAGSEPLVERLGLAPGMRVLDAGCGPGRLTIPVARAVGATGEVVALDSQRAMLEKLEHRLEAESTINVRTLEAGLGEGVLEREAFDRVLLAFVLGEVRDREAAARELYAALKPGGILSVTEIFGDPDYRRPASVRRVVEPAGFELVERFGGFPVNTLNFRRPGSVPLVLSNSRVRFTASSYEKSVSVEITYPSLPVRMLISLCTFKGTHLSVCRRFLKG